MNSALEIKLQFLCFHGVDRLKHSKYGLLAHLLGTYHLLNEWGTRPALCDAGLFHSVYGTQGYEPAAVPAAMRDEVRGLIGTEAESLVWLFGSIRHETFVDNLHRQGDFRVQDRRTQERLAVSHEQFHDLIQLSVANTLEALPWLSWTGRRACRVYSLPFRPFALPGAKPALARLAAWQWWQLWR